MNTKNLEKNNNNFYWPQGLETKSTRSMPIIFFETKSKRTH
jgi:hypothetical protein